MIAQVLLWMIPLVVLLIAVVIWLIFQVSKEQKLITAELSEMDQSEAIKCMTADLNMAMHLIAQDVRLAAFYKEERDALVLEIQDLKSRTEKAEADAFLEKNRRIGAVAKMAKMKSCKDDEEWPF